MERIALFPLLNHPFSALAENGFPSVGASARTTAGVGMDRDRNLHGAQAPTTCE